MYIQQSIGEALGLIQAFEYGHINHELFIQELQKLFPFDPRSFRKDTWQREETVLSYYGLDAKAIFSNFDKFAYGNLLTTIDQEKILDLLANCSKHKVINFAQQVVLKELITFLKEKRVPVPEHLLDLEILQTMIESEQVKHTSSQQTKTPKKTKKSLRIEIMRAAATLFWDSEIEGMESLASKTKKLTNSSELSKKREMIQLVNLVNKIGNIKPIEDKAHSSSGIDPEWFSDLFPGEKPGPKKKRIPKRVE